MRLFTISFLLSVLYANSAYCFWGEHSAVNTYRAGDYRGALSQFETLLIERPDDAQLLYNAGKAAYKTQEYDAAASYFERAAKQKEIDCTLAEHTWFDLGNTHVKQKKWQEALSSYEQVLTLNPEHKEAQEMIEKIKKLLEQQKQQEKQSQNQDSKQNQDKNQQQQNNNQEQNNDQQQNQDGKNQENSDQNKNQQQQNNKEQQSKDQRSRDKADKQEQNGDGQDNEQEQQQGDEQSESNDQSGDGNDSGTSDNTAGSGKQSPQNKNQQHEEQSSGNDGKSEQEQPHKDQSNQDVQNGKSTNDHRKEQNLDNKNAEQCGEEVGDKGQRDKADKDPQHNGGDDLENAVPDIQDHQRNNSSKNHSASPLNAQPQSTKQDTPLKGKAQEAQMADPFTIDDGIDKNSREGKILQFIESRDAQAQQQLLKMNVQTQRKPGEKNW